MEIKTRKNFFQLTSGGKPSGGQHLHFYRPGQLAQKYLRFIVTLWEKYNSLTTAGWSRDYKARRKAKKRESDGVRLEAKTGDAGGGWGGTQCVLQWSPRTSLPHHYWPDWSDWPHQATSRCRRGEGQQWGNQETHQLGFYWSPYCADVSTREGQYLSSRCKYIDM